MTFAASLFEKQYLIHSVPRVKVWIKKAREVFGRIDLALLATVKHDYKQTQLTL